MLNFFPLPADFYFDQLINILYSANISCAGSSPEYSKGTYVPVFPTRDRQSTWGGRITENNGNIITMGITPDANCIVGKYQMFVAIQTPFGIRRTKRDRSRDLYILFNPWLAGLCTVQKNLSLNVFKC